MTPTDTLDLLTAKVLFLSINKDWATDIAIENIPTAYIRHARAIRLAHAKAGVQSVPVVATEPRMVDAGYEGFQIANGHKPIGGLKTAWHMMLEASPYRTEVQP